jgi:membrane-associated protease RseP (regulator of RpoE activity)
MNWLWFVVFLVAVYGAAVLVIRRYHLWEDHVTFYGPVLALKTEKVGFFDFFRRFKPVLRGYGTIGVAMVLLVSFFMTLTVVFAVQETLRSPPDPEGIYALPNLLAIPGVNEYIPFTFAVWFAFVLTLVVHEFGHAVLCRIEDIRVKSMGVLFAVIPIGAFVEPDEDDVNNAPAMPKVRMYGAGIMNNIVFGLLCFALMVALLGMASPQPGVYVNGIYQGSAAQNAGLQPDTIILEINGTPVTMIDDVSGIVSRTSPGDVVMLRGLHDGGVEDYELTLSAWPVPIMDTVDLRDAQATRPLPTPGGENCTAAPADASGEEVPAEIWVSSVPPGAEIIMDGFHTGCYTNTTITLPAGTHQLAFEKEDLGRSENVTVTVAAYSEYGFMGVTFYNQANVKNTFDLMRNGLWGFAILIYAPIDHFLFGNGMQLGLLLIDSPQSIVWDVPFAHFWTVIQVLFWSSWFNIAVGTFNALPMIPLDGGYIMQEGVTRFFERRNMGKFAGWVVAGISTLMLMLILSLIALPYLLNLSSFF